MRKIRTAVAVVAVAASLSLTGCMEDVCEEIPVTPEDAKLVAQGYELEREYRGSDCELSDGTQDWQAEID